MSLSRCKKLITRQNLLKRFTGRFNVICPFFHPFKLIGYTSSYLNNKTDYIHRCSKSIIIIPIGCYIAFSCSLVYGGSRKNVQTKGEHPSCIRLLFTIAENSYNTNVCEMTHNLTKDEFCSDVCSICMLFKYIIQQCITD